MKWYWLGYSAMEAAFLATPGGNRWVTSACLVLGLGFFIITVAEEHRVPRR